ncbi:MAG: TonB-dependent receptor [Ignavibacteria bacterium]|nr:TonB-dependent receptor [Ignavibacteria bacterium]
MSSQLIRLGYAGALMIAICSTVLSVRGMQLLDGDATFSGIVVDSATQVPLVGASLELLPIKKGCFTQKRGVFSCENFPAGDYTLLVKYVGYQIHTQKIRIPLNSPLKIKLQQSDVALKATIIEGEREITDAPTKQIVKITSAELDEHRGQTLGDALKTINGVTTLQTGPSISKPVIHGLHSQRIAVMNAGVAQEGQQWGAEHAPEIDPFSISTIEVLKGAATIEYGAGAIGGVIRVEPRELPTSPIIGGEFTANGFTNNRQGAASLLVEGGIPSVEGLGWRTQASARKAGNSEARDYWLGNTGFEELNASAAIGYASEDFIIKGYYSHFGTTLGVFLGSHFGNQDDLMRAIAAGRPLTEYEFSYTISGPKQVIAHDLWTVNASYRLSDAWKIESQYGYQVNNRQEFDARKRYNDTISKVPVPSFSLNLTSMTLDTKLRYTPDGELSATFGASGLYQVNVGQSLTYLLPNFSVSGLSGYAIGTWTTPELIVNSGLRLDVRSQRTFQYTPKNVPDSAVTYTGLSGSLGALWTLSPITSLGANLSTTFRIPSINELYSDGVHHGTAQYEMGNRTLSPERGISSDVTLKVTTPKLSTEISAYLHYFNGFIYSAPALRTILTLRGVFPVFEYRQTSAMITGIDANFTYVASEVVRLDASLSWLLGNNLVTNEALFQMPAPRAKLGPHLHLGDWGELLHNYLEINGQFVARQVNYPENADYSLPPAGYALFDISAGTEIPISETHKIHLNAAVQNLFDRDYRDYLSRFRYFTADVGRTFIIRLKIPFGEFPDE